MTTKTKTTKSPETAVLDSAADAVSLTLVKPSDIAGEPANVALTLTERSALAFPWCWSRRADS